MPSRQLTTGRYHLAFVSTAAIIVQTPMQQPEKKGPIAESHASMS